MRVAIIISVLVALAAAVPPEKSLWECTLCKGLVALVGELIGEDESTIQQRLDGFCDELGPLGTECKKMVDDYLIKIVNMLNNGSTDDEICQEIGMCQSFVFQQKKQTKNIFDCEMCKELVEMAAKYLGQDESTIVQELESFCSDLGPLASTCKDLVDTYVKEILDLLQSGATADVICEKIGMCDSAVKKIPVAKLMAAKKVVKSPQFGECDICKVIVEAAQALLGLGTDEIEKKLDDVCDGIPFVGSECKKLVAKYVGEIVAYLKAGKTTDEVCKLITLCSKFDQILLNQIHARTMAMVEQLKAKRQPKDFTCDLCVEIAAEVGKYLGQDETEIVQELESFCSDLGPLASTCKSLVDEYVPKLIGYLQDGQSDKDACAAVGLC
jgi:hypothetical protein